jgi:diguanylate cyclase (GGDEF)-like protein
LSSGARLLTAGQPNRRLFIILQGVVEVHLPGHDGAHVRVAQGECVGELSLIDGQVASADVVAACETTLLELSHEDVWAVVDGDPTFARNLLRILAGRVRNDDVALTLSSDRRRHYERLSMVDSLTSLHNRRWLDAVFPPHVERLLGEERPVALFMVDADHFKALNDAHGHAAGDIVLQRVAQALRDALRPEDLLARYGGEEFAALVADVDACAALDVAERLRLAVARMPLPASMTCSISIGVAVAVAGDTFESISARADAALLRAKAAGRNRVCG